MADKVSIYIFDEHIADIYQEEDSVYLRQIDNKAHKASPISIPSGVNEIETSELKFLERVPGFVSDSLPGSFGTDILNNFFQENTNGKLPTVVDKLLFIGNRGLGALEFRPQAEIQESDIKTLSLKEVFEKAKELKRGDNLHSIYSAFLVSAHSFVGGARSKVVGAINIENGDIYLGDRNETPPKDFIPAIIKYDDTSGDDENKSTYSKLEYVYYLLAKMAGIKMMDCYLLESNSKSHFVTKRFDIENGEKSHVHSFAGLLHTDYNLPRETGYEELLRVAVKLNTQKSLKQLFLQMLFNYMFVNQDDHSRNFSFMCDSKYQWEATPAYDITFAKGEKQTVEHQLSLYGKALSKSTLEDIVRLATEFSISIEFVSEAISKMQELRVKELPKLMKEYKVSDKKQKQVLEAVKVRDFQGALDEQ